jgi:hypothetical protein
MEALDRAHECDLAERQTGSHLRRPGLSNGDLPALSSLFRRNLESIDHIELAAVQPRILRTRRQTCSPGRVLQVWVQGSANPFG